MTWLAPALYWTVVRVSILLVPIFGLHLLASRRGPAAGAWTATFGLVLISCVTVWGFLPESARPSPVFVPEAAMPEVVDPSVPPQQARAVSVARSLSWFRARFEPAVDAALPKPSGWSAFPALILLAGACFGLIRLGVGLAAIARCVRRGRRLEDGTAAERLAGLKARAGVTRAVALVESDEVRAPATAGWFFPVILLPNDHRGWSGEELDAVLAHELAHIARLDYQAGLAAQLALAIHFYHPLVRRLTARLGLQQELAADAAGARLTGGSASYLRSLATLVLRLDGSVPNRTARAFLPPQGALMRRIQMLRDEQTPPERPWSLRSRIMSGLPLMVLAVAAASLRGPAREASAEDRAKGSEVVSAAELQFIPSDDMGFAVIRPAAILGKPSMKPFRDELNRRINTNIGIDARTGARVETRLPIEIKLDEIEWMTMGLSFGRTKLDGVDKRSLTAGGFTARTTRPWDRDKLLGALGLKLVRLTESGKTYYRVEGPLVGLAAGRNHQLGLYFPDDRTWVFREIGQLKALLGRAAPSAPAYVNKRDWDRIRGGVVALMFDGSDGRVAKILNREIEEDAEFLPILSNSRNWLLRIEDSDRFGLELVTNAKDVGGAAAIVTSLRGLGKKHLAGDVIRAGFTPLMPNLKADSFIVEAKGTEVSVRAKDLGSLEAMIRGLFE